MNLKRPAGINTIRNLHLGGFEAGAAEAELLGAGGAFGEAEAAPPGSTAQATAEPSESTETPTRRRRRNVCCDMGQGYLGDGYGTRELTPPAGIDSQSMLAT